MANDTESGSRLDLRILEQSLQSPGRTDDAQRLGARRTKAQGFLPPAKSREAELMQ